MILLSGLIIGFVTNSRMFRTGHRENFLYYIGSKTFMKVYHLIYQTLAEITFINCRKLPNLFSELVVRLVLILLLLVSSYLIVNDR